MRSSFLLSLLHFNYKIKKYFLVIISICCNKTNRDAPLCNPTCDPLGNKFAVDVDFCLCL